MEAERKRDLLAALDARPVGNPEAWKPEVGGAIVGEIVEYRKAEARHGPTQIAVIREDDSGVLRSVWLFHTVLKAEFARLLPEPGERIAIRRVEDGQKGERSYRRFSVVVDREDLRAGEEQGEAQDVAV